MKQGQVSHKRRNMAMLLDGEYGNKLRVWESVEDVELSGFQGPVTVRCLRSGGGGCCIYDVDVKSLRRTVEYTVAAGYSLGELYFNEGAPDQYIVVQGELYNGVVDVQGVAQVDRFEFSTVKKKMRDALKEERRATHGAGTRLIMSGMLSPKSLADLERVVQLYPDHVVEISIYSRYLGDLPRRNALIWEVRAY